jgi:tRNA(fMet)-specific endonuclease VapC
MVVDTGIVIEHLRAKDKLNTTFSSIPDNLPVFITTVSLFELMMGATSKEKLYDIKFLVDDLEVLDFESHAAEKASEIFRTLKTRNQLIEFRDIFIAAVCITNNLPLLTLNKKHFTRVEELLLS